MSEQQEAVNENRMPAAEFVAANKATIEKSDYQAIVALGKEAGFDDRDSYVEYKEALKEVLGIDMAERRAAWTKDLSKARDKEFAQASTIALHTHADAKEGRFAIANDAGDVIWAGRFFDREADQPQNICDINVAKKAIYLAGNLAQDSEEKVKLTLNATASWLTATNEAISTAGQKGGRANVVAKVAREAGIGLTVQAIDGKDSPAKTAVEARTIVKHRDGQQHLALQAPTRARKTGNGR